MFIVNLLSKKRHEKIAKLPAIPDFFGKPEDVFKIYLLAFDDKIAVEFTEYLMLNRLDDENIRVAETV